MWQLEQQLTDDVWIYTHKLVMLKVTMQCCISYGVTSLYTGFYIHTQNHANPGIINAKENANSLLLDRNTNMAAARAMQRKHVGIRLHFALASAGWTTPDSCSFSGCLTRALSQLLAVE